MWETLRDTQQLPKASTLQFTHMDVIDARYTNIFSFPLFIYLFYIFISRYNDTLLKVSC